MDAVPNLHAYTYRVPRFSLQVPVEFLVEEASIPGFSVDFSETGLQVRLARPVTPGGLGRLRLRLDGCMIEIEAEAVHCQLLDVGFRFRFSSAAEEQFIRILVKVLSKSVSRSGLNNSKDLGAVSLSTREREIRSV